ncbi:MAG: hypothetical protein WA361_17800, partial [Candidatus Acidiferrales bacterium]
ARGQAHRELSPERGQARQQLSPAPDPLYNRANDPRPSRRVPILFPDRREAAHRALAGTKAWPPKAVAEEAGVANSLAAPPIPMTSKIKFPEWSGRNEKESE